MCTNDFCEGICDGAGKDKSVFLLILFLYVWMYSLLVKTNLLILFLCV